MKAEKAKKMAAELLKVGVHKIWINPESEERLKEAMTKEDVRALIKDRIIKKRKEQEQSRARARILHAKKKKRRKSGYGKRTGSRKARSKEKKSWMHDVRAQRKKLRELKEKKLKLKIS